MGDLSNLLVELISLAIQAMTILIIARSLLSWFIQDPFNPIMKVLNDLTEPILQPIRSRLGGGMGFDLSPLIAIVGLQILGRLAIGLIS